VPAGYVLAGGQVGRRLVVDEHTTNSRRTAGYNIPVMSCVAQNIFSRKAWQTPNKALRYNTRSRQLVAPGGDDGTGSCFPRPRNAWSSAWNLELPAALGPHWSTSGPGATPGASPFSPCCTRVRIHPWSPRGKARPESGLDPSDGFVIIRNCRTSPGYPASLFCRSVCRHSPRNS